MPYLKIPPSFLPETIAKLVSKIEQELSIRVQEEAGRLVDNVRSEGCPTNLSRAVQKTQGLQNGVNQLNSRLTKLKRLPKAILIPIRALEKIIKLILRLPIPQSPSPVPGLPMSVTNKITDLIITVLEFIAQKKEDAEAIVAIVEGPSQTLEFLNRQIGQLRNVVGVCRIHQELERKLAEGELSFEELFERGLINDEGGLITSNLGAQYLGSGGGRSVSDIANDLGISNQDVVDRIKKAKEDQDGDGNIDINGTFDKSDNDLNKELSDILDKFEGLGLDSVSDLRNTLDSLVNIPVDKSLDPRFFHTGPDGTVYKLDIRIDENSPKVAPLRFAVALDNEDVAVLTGPKSFASDTDILLNEIKFRIDNQLS